MAYPIPPLCLLRRELPTGERVVIDTVMRHEWERLDLAAQVSGQRIAIGIGSRGVANIAEIAQCLVALVKASGGDPFIVPAMGSHGGATPAGQIEVLHGLGVTEERVGCPLRATMETVILGETAQGLPVHIDRYAAEADGLLIANRVKIHTDFHGQHESGLLKMLAIGLGKEAGATLLHDYGVPGLRDRMPEVAKVQLEKVNFIAGVATVEDSTHRPVRLEILTKDTVIAGEQRLLDYSRTLFPQLPVDDLDVLIVDYMGKEISGTGLDTNVIGRWRIDGEPEPETPRIKALVVLDLSAVSHGNATGIGLADFTVRRLVDKIDFGQFSKNVFTSGFLNRGRIPLVFATDTEAIEHAIRHAFRRHPDGAADVRMMRIRNTLELAETWVTPNLLDEVKASPGFVSAGAPQELPFHDGALF